MTHKPLVLGLLGLAEGLPFIALALFGGHVADRYDRRSIILCSVGCVLAGSLLLWWSSLPIGQQLLTPPQRMTLIYGVVVALGLARGFHSPAASSLRALLVPRDLYANSSAWSSVAWQGAAVLGPVAAGLSYGQFGFTGTLLAVAICFAAAMLSFAMVGPHPPSVQPDNISLWQSLREGIDFVWRTPIILHSISLDLFSVLFGGVVAILPVFATDILNVGSEGLGILRAAPAAGALLTLLACTRYPPTHRAWRNLLIAVTGFGVATLVFALSRNFILSAFALFLTGAFDSISVVIRGTVLQMMPPDHLRGRVLSVNGIFITTSNELGAFESGVAAQLLGTVPSVLAGGAVTLLVVFYVWRRTRDLLAVRLTP
jgi:MFS family permease